MDDRDEDGNARDTGQLTPATPHVGSAHTPVRRCVTSVRTLTPVVAAPKGGELKAVATTTRPVVPRQRRGA